MTSITPTEETTMLELDPTYLTYEMAYRAERMNRTRHGRIGPSRPRRLRGRTARRTPAPTTTDR